MADEKMVNRIPESLLPDVITGEDGAVDPVVNTGEDEAVGEGEPVICDADELNEAVKAASPEKVLEKATKTNFGMAAEKEKESAAVDGEDDTTVDPYAVVERDEGKEDKEKKKKKLKRRKRRRRTEIALL